MKQILALGLIAVALSGCQTSSEPQSPFDPKSLPEYAEHYRCIGRQTFIYSKAEGSPLELGTIASAGCNATRANLYKAVAKAKGGPFARGYIGASETEDPKTIAGAIIKVRQGRDPF